MMDFTFEPAPWEQALENISGDRLSAARFLTLMEGQEEWAFEEALEELEARNISLDVEDLPRDLGSGQTAVRLRREEQLVRSGHLMEDLEDTDPLKMYLQELAGVPAFGDVNLLAERLLEGDRSVVEQLTNLMLSRVLECACGMVGRGVLLQDLIQEGSLGLWQGMLCYAGGDIESHCDWYIRSAMAKAVTVQARSSGVGQKLRTAMEDYRAVDERLLGELGRTPTTEEIAEAMHITPQEVTVVAGMLESARMMAQVKREPEPEQEQQEEQQAVEDTAYFQMRQRVQDLLADLEEREAQLLRLRFGLEGSRPLSPEEIGKQMELTPEEVVAVEAAALAKLRTKG